jgi:hypothetical protein
MVHNSYNYKNIWNLLHRWLKYMSVVLFKINGSRSYMQYQKVVAVFCDVLLPIMSSVLHRLVALLSCVLCKMLVPVIFYSAIIITSNTRFFTSFHAAVVSYLTEVRIIIHQAKGIFLCLPLFQR